MACTYYGDDKIESLVGKTLTSVENKDDNEIVFTSDDGDKYIMCHYQDCCESVTVEDICGDLDDIVGSPILTAEESTSYANPEGINPEDQDSFTWTFYKIATNKGSVTIRWYGESNGYYSESVDFSKLDNT